MHDKDRHASETGRERDMRLSADALGQLDDQQRQLLEIELQADVEMRSQHEDLVRVADALSRQHATESLPAPSLELRGAIEARLESEVRSPNTPAKPTNERSRWSRRRMAVTLLVTASVLVLVAVPVGQIGLSRRTTRPLASVQEKNADHRLRRQVAERGVPLPSNLTKATTTEANPANAGFVERGRAEIVFTEGQSKHLDLSSVDDSNVDFHAELWTDHDALPAAQMAIIPIAPQPATEEHLGEAILLGQSAAQPRGYGGSASGYPVDAKAGLGGMGGAGLGTAQGMNAGAGGMVREPTAQLRGSAPTDSYGIAGQNSPPAAANLAGTVVKGWHESADAGWGALPGRRSEHASEYFERQIQPDGESRHQFWHFTAPQPPTNREQYEAIVENPFVPVSQQALSTLSIDVDTASYANVRRFLTQNQLPPANAVRIEELINYFSYDYPAPEDDQPFASHLEVTECPWQPKHRLVRVGLQGKTIARQERPGCNLVFLLDVSGSMKDSNKLPLLKQAMKLLVDQLDENDRVAIVTYASQAGIRLKSTVADKHDVIRDAINGLNANGSTNGGAGIQLAYEQALAGAIEGGVNRVILATDGDLNVGITDDDALVRLIKEKAASDVFLTVLGFGEGNLQDAKLEKLADNGNGLYAYIDNLREARKVLVEQVAGSLVTIAKDVKIKVEFNPAEVQSYRLIGYENRLMTAAEFDDDKKDAGEIGAGHSVTAIYEIVPAAPAQLAAAETLKYQQPAAPAVPDEQLTDAAKTGELLTLSLRYKLPDSDESTLVEVPLLNSRKRFSEASLDFRFATAVASFGMLLRDSVHRGDTSFAAVEEIASAAIGDDEKGHRTEFLDLVRLAATLK